MGSQANGPPGIREIQGRPRACFFEAPLAPTHFARNTGESLEPGEQPIGLSPLSLTLSQLPSRLQA